jgi:stage II sporulation protein D
LQTRKEKEKVVGYSLIGGGFGHGAGMSQNCAKQMAVEGYSYEQILQFFFENCTIEQCK